MPPRQKRHIYGPIAKATGGASVLRKGFSSASNAVPTRPARSPHLRQAGAVRSGFTLVEVMVALAVVAIGVMALLRLQLVSIVMTERATRTTAAVLLMDAVMDEILAGPFPQPGVSEGRFDGAGGGGMFWRVDVREVRLPGLEEESAEHLREVRVAVWWEGVAPGEGVEAVAYAAQREEP